MIIAAIFFALFGVSGVNVGLRGARDIEVWLAIPPVLLAVGLAIWRGLASDPALHLILTGMAMVFAASALGALSGVAMGRLLRMPGVPS